MDISTLEKAQDILIQMRANEKILVSWQSTKNYSLDSLTLVKERLGDTCSVPHFIPFSEMQRMAIEHYSTKIKELKKEFEAL